ncbi:CopG family transcriptional regulator [Nostoc sp. FACHB-888]|uniref:CopG family transcriptional regulator n=1 Tax=Nostoc sp. FACHB-888 TaxID=2692842 RepID=UPI0016823DE9|nr:CopG family transcriptional regulator [Nostoc sp. FACHB-888]MBD2248712.1 CopG family transcriptional regulator [Nostoc sp. FACHB-888]
MNKKWAVKRMILNLTSSESEKLEQYYVNTGRPTTDVIRKLIRSLSITELSASE